MAPGEIKVLLIEDQEPIVELVRAFFTEIENSPFGLQVAYNLLDGLEIMRGGIDVVLLDLNLPDSRGLDTLKSILVENPDIPVVVYTGIDDEEVAIQAVREGAQDYLIKSPVSTDSPVRSIRYALERKWIENALRNSEEINRKIVDNSNIGIVVVSEGIVELVNPKFAEIVEFSEEEILNRSFLELVHPDDFKKVNDARSKRLKGVETIGFLSFRIVDKLGESKWVEAKATEINWEGSTSTIVFINDVTRRKEAEEELERHQHRLEELVEERTRELNFEIEERKRAEETLRGSEEKWRHLFETSTDVIYLSTTDGSFIDINKAGEKLFGYKREELLSTGIRGLCSDPDDWLKFQKSFADEGYIKDGEITFRRKDGSIIDGLVSSTLRRNADGIVVGNQGIIKDITEKKKAHETMLDSIADGMLTIDKDFTVVSVNAALEDILGLDKKELIGRKITEVFKSEIKDNYSELMKLLKSWERVIDFKAYVAKKRGLNVPVSISSSNLTDLKGNITGSVITFRDLSAIEELRKELTAGYTFEDIVSKNPKIKDIFDVLPDIAESDSTVLIEGSSGTGKELFSRAIHNLSHRKSGPFVAVNCGALPENLLESELFGYSKGAFTDAVTKKPGRFALARNGTIFLDEIGELPLSLQVKLLRVLQEKEYYPLGSVNSESVDVRIIASTNKDLSKEVYQGNFREDLFYRLNVVNLHLPELKERKEDIPLLVEHFKEKFSRKMEKNIKGVTDEVMDLLMRHDFPGNVRELENIIERAFVLCRGSVITIDHLPRELFDAAGVTREEMKSMRYIVIDAEKRMIEEALERYKGNRSRVAEALDMGRSTLYRKMRYFNIK